MKAKKEITRDKIYKVGGREIKKEEEEVEKRRKRRNIKPL